MKSYLPNAAIFAVLSVSSLGAENPMVYFRAEDAVAYSNCVKSLKNVQRGELYTMTWDKDADYHLDRFLSESGCTTSDGATGWLCEHVLDNAPPPPAVTDTGCSAFAATNAAGAWLAGRNFDYRYRMTHALVYIPKSDSFNRPHASVSTVDCGWIGYDVGGLDDGIRDVSYAALFPHIPLDGMNDAGVVVTVLSLEGRPRPGAGPDDKSWMTEQYYPDRTNIVTTAAIRYLLDHAGSTEEGIHMLTNNFNMFAAIGGDVPISANYHLYLCDRSGDARVVEWLPPKDGGKNWTAWVTNATAVSNFYFYDGYGHGSNRWEILRHALAQQNGCLEEDEAMCLARAVAQKKGAEQTSWTHWSIVYNLKDLSANIATLGNWDEIFPYRLKDAGGWEIDTPKSARPEARSTLPFVDLESCEPDKVYGLSYQGPHVPSPRVYDFSYDGAVVSAANRMGVTHDTAKVPKHAVIDSTETGKCHYLAYADFSPQVGQVSGNWVEFAVAGLNRYGVAGRVVRLAKAVTASGGTVPAGISMCIAFNEGAKTADEAVAKLNWVPDDPYAGVLFTDAKGNVAIWPEGAELPKDEATEMVRNSLDLRKGIYETDGKGWGQFDELPGLMRLAATDKTRAVISMGYGHLDVMLPETNRVWRVALEDADIPQYGIVAEPPTVAHATLKSLRYANGNEIERNNQGRIVAKTGAEMEVTYTADAGYRFSNGTGTLTQRFTVGETVTTPPAETPVYHHLNCPVSYHSAGGAYSDGVETITRPESLVKGYGFPPEPPTRKDFTLAGWFTSWRSDGDEVRKGDTIKNPEPHTLYARWSSTAPSPTAGRLVLGDFNDDGTPRNEVAANAYANDSALMTLTTSLYVTNIGQRAFYNCPNLKELTLMPPRSYDDIDVLVPLAIGPMAFAGSAIEDLVLPAKVALGAGAFVNATKLKRVFFLGDETIDCEDNAFLRCGDGTLKLYMSSAFQLANPDIGKEVQKQNPSVTVKTLVGVSPVMGVGDVALDPSALAPDGTVTLDVAVKTQIAGTAPEEPVEVRYKARLADAWQTIPSTVLAVGTDEVILQITPPVGASGFFQVVVR